MNTGDAHVQRNYRRLHSGSDLKYFGVGLKETDLAIGVDKGSFAEDLIAICEREIRRLRGGLEDFITVQPDFMTSLVPITLLPGAPGLAVRMSQAGWQAGVGPMAAVAGALAQAVGQTLRSRVNEVIVENGGDLYIDTSKSRLVSVYAGRSPFSGKIGVRIEPGESPLGMCTSSGTVGPSLSFGKADAVVIKGSDAALADAVATGAANRIQTPDDFTAAIEYVQKIPGITGILAVVGEQLAAWGNMELVSL